jgi:phosphate transport system permease protein
LVRIVRIAINNLAGVPSIVFGVFGLGFFVYVVGGRASTRCSTADTLPNPTFGTGGILWASLTLALLTVPVVIVATEEALAGRAHGDARGLARLRRQQVADHPRVVLPRASARHHDRRIILAMARGAGEVAPLMITGVVKLAPDAAARLATFPFMHLERKFMHLGFHIYDVGFQSPEQSRPPSPWSSPPPCC